MAVVDIAVGRSTWSLNVRDGDLVTASQAVRVPIADVRAAVYDALNRPVRFEPFRRALTPDDRIALVIDESLPRVAELVAGVLEYLAECGIPPSAVTAISPAGSPQHWIDALPESLADLQTEIHHPGDRQRLSYLATTKDGRKIYLNRTLVDADQSIILTGRAYDPLLGHAGAAGTIYPGLADAETMRSVVPRLAPQTDPDRKWPVAEEAVEVAWLLGSPFFVQVIEGEGDSIVGILAGLANSALDGLALQDATWKSTIDSRVDTVVVALAGDPARHDFAALARAAACGARAVKQDGAIVILSEADPELGKATDVLRRCDDPPEAVKTLFREKPADAAAAVQWAWAAGQARLFVASEIRPTTIEEMFATSLTGPREAQRLVDAAGKVLIIPDADKAWVTAG